MSEANRAFAELSVSVPQEVDGVYGKRVDGGFVFHFPTQNCMIRREKNSGTTMLENSRMNPKVARRTEMKLSMNILRIPDMPPADYYHEVLQFRIYSFASVFNTDKTLPEGQAYLTDQNRAKGFLFRFHDQWRDRDGLPLNATITVLDEMDDNPVCHLCYIQHDGDDDNSKVITFRLSLDTTLDLIPDLTSKLFIDLTSKLFIEHTQTDRYPSRTCTDHKSFADGGRSA